GNPHRTIIGTLLERWRESKRRVAGRDDNRCVLPDFVAKLCPRAELLPRLAELARPVVFTNGVFDILHRGHVTYLDHACSLGASLVVAVNSDDSVRRLGKG